MSRRRPPGILRAPSLLAAAVLCGAAWASGLVGSPGLVAEVPLWDATIEVTEGAVAVSAGGTTLVYVDGLGWLADFVAPPPRVLDGVAWVAPEVAAALGLAPEPSGRATPGDGGAPLA
ncbi:MAG: hypothetical protein K0A98_13735, partial [Trueperaceae bacterium]|nr:hypothetical protein [Trueperaceae bacterium]